MRTVHAILIAMIATALMAAVPAAFEQANADITSEDGIVIVKGDTALDGDLRIEGGSDILILDGASVDIRDHTLEIGQGSKMAAIGSASISSSGGSVVFEGGRPLSIGTVTLPKSTEDVAITFEGTIRLDFKPLSGTLSLGFEPSGSDHGVHATYGNSALALQNPNILVRFGPGTADVKTGFSELTLTRDKYDGNKLVSSSSLTMVSNDPGDALDLAFYLKDEGQGHVYVKDMNVSSVKTSTHYQESGLTRSSLWSGFDRLDSSLDDDGTLHVSSHIGNAVFERSLNGALQSRTSVDDIDWSLAFDLTVLFKILDSEISGDSEPDASDLIEEVDVTARSVKIENLAEGTTKGVSDASVVMKRNGSTSYILTIQWTDENGRYKISTSELVIDSFGLSSSLMMDLDVSVSNIRVEIEPFDGAPSSLDASGLELEIDNLDLKGLYEAISRTGTMDVQLLLDNCQRLHSYISSAVYAKDGREMAVRGLDVVLEEDGRMMSTLTLSIDGLKGTMALEDGTLKADVGRTTIYLSTDGSLAEYIDALKSGSRITADSEMTLQAKTDGVDIDYSGTDKSVSIIGKKTSSAAVAMELDLSVRHTTYKDSTLLDGDFSASGYRITVEVHDYEKGSSLNIVLSNPEATLEDMDLARIHEEAKQIGPADIMDGTERIVVAAESAAVDYDDVHATFKDLRIESNSTVRHSVSVNSGRIDIAVPIEGGDFEAKAASVSLSLSSDQSFKKLQEAYDDGFEFDSDASIDVEARLTGAHLDYDSDVAHVVISGEEPSTLFAELSFEHSERWAKTLLSAELSAPGYGISVKSAKTDLEISASDPELELKDVDADAVRPMVESGDFDIATILDNTESVTVKASSAELERSDLRVELASAEIKTDSSGRYTASAECGSLSAHVPSDNGMLDADAGAVSARFTSDSSFRTVLDAFKNGLKFESDVGMDAEALLTGAAVSYSSESVSLSLVEKGGTGTSVATVEASLKHVEADSRTLLDLKLDADGYDVTMEANDSGDGSTNVDASDPHIEATEADLDAIISAYDESGTFTLKMLDSCRSLGISTSSLEVLTTGEKDVSLNAEELTLETRSNPGSSLKLASGRLSVSVPTDDGRLELKAASAKASLSSDLTFEKLQKIYENGFEFDSDASIDLDAELAGAEADYAAGSTGIVVSGSESSVLSVELSLEHSERWSKSVLDAGLSALGYEVSAKSADMEASASDPELKLEDVNLEAIRPMLESKDFDIATLLDNAESVTAKASSAEFERGDLRFEFASAEVKTDSSGRYTASAKCGSLTAHAPFDDGVLDVSAGASSAHLTSGAPFSDLLAVFKDGLKLGYDAKMSMEASLDDLEATYSGETASISVSEADQESLVTVAASLSYYKASSRTLLDLNVKAEEHVMTAKATSADGSLDLTASGPSLNVSEADLGAIASIYDDKGTIAPEMLDCCKSLEFAAKGLDVHTDGDKNLTLNAERPVLRIGTVPESSFQFESSRLSLSADVEDGAMELESSSVKANFASDAPFSEIADIIENGLEFESDVRMDAEAFLTWAVMSYSSESVSLSLSEDGGPGTSVMTLKASLQNVEAASKTLLDLDADAEGYVLEFESRGLHRGKLPLKGDDLRLMANGPALDVKGLEISYLLQVYDDGGLSIQQVLDHCDSIELSTRHAEVEWDGDGESDVVLDDASAGLSRNVDGLAVIAFVMENAKASVPLEDMAVDIRAASTELSLSSDVEFSELVDLVLDGMKFEKDADADLSLKSGWLDLRVDKDGGSYSLSFTSKDDPAGSPVRLDLRMIHSSYNDQTTVSGRLDASGYTTVVEAHIDGESSGRFLSIPYSTSKSSQLKAVLDDLSSDVGGFDIGAAYDIIEREGTLTVQQLLDCGDSMDIGASHASLDIDADGEYEILVSGLGAALSKSAVGQNVMSLTFEDMATSMDLKKGTVSIRSGSSEIVMVSQGSLTECIDAFLYGVDFSKETHAEVTLSNESIRLEYGKEKEFISLTNEKMSETSPKYVNVVLSIGYSEYNDVTSLVGKVTSIGHSLVLSDNTVVNGENGIVRLTCSTDEVSGGFEADFGKDVGFSVNLFMPWTMSFEYYDIEFKMVSEDSVVSLTNGALHVDGYDPKEQGILAIVPAIKNDDFSAEARLLMSSSGMTLYGKDGTTVLDSYGDAEIDVRKASVDLKRGDALEIQLEKIGLSVTNKDGKVVERSLNRLDVTKDQTGAVPEEGWVEKNALALAIAFIAASVVMATYMVLRHRKLYKREYEE